VTTWTVIRTFASSRRRDMLKGGRGQVVLPWPTDAGVAQLDRQQPPALGRSLSTQKARARLNKLESLYRALSPPVRSSEADLRISAN
jgi:hypothetical protein